MSGRERIAEVLAGHLERLPFTSFEHSDPLGCSCGAELDQPPWPTDWEAGMEIHRAHVAEVLTDVLADVWDETCRAVGWAQDNGPIESALLYVAGHNPYRTRTA